MPDEKTPKRSRVLEITRAIAAALGAFVGGAVAVNQLVIGDSDRTFSETWAELSTSAAGLATLAVLASIAALTNRFASPAPSVEQIAASTDENRAQWKPLSAEAQAWREFVADIVPTIVVGASFGFSTIAVVAQFAGERDSIILVGIVVALVLFGAIFGFLSLRRAELEEQIEASWTFQQVDPTPGHSQDDRA